MVVKHPIKTINCTNGELFGVIDTRRKLLGTCEPVITIYRQDNPVKILGRTSYGLKSWHIGIVLCDLQLAKDMDYDRIKQVTGFEMAADVLVGGNAPGEYVAERIRLRDLYPEWIDPRDMWRFSTEDQAEIDELLALRNI